MEWTLVSSRIISARFYSKKIEEALNNTCIYAPTNDARDEDKNQFYGELQAAVWGLNRYDTMIITGDMKARVGPGWQRGDGKNGLGVRNYNGERWLFLALHSSYIALFSAHCVFCVVCVSLYVYVPT